MAVIPYGFYQFVRFVGLSGFAFLAYRANQQCRQTEMIIYAGLALLFQPFFKIVLGRKMWNIVDVVVGIGLLISIFYATKGKPALKASTFAIRTSQRANAHTKNCKKASFAKANKNCV